jgi:hypothetical protein
MRRPLLHFALTLTAMALCAQGAQACSCVEYDVPACAAFWRADAVFVGVVTDIKKLPEESPQALPVALIHFIVEDGYRGVSAPEVDVATMSGTMCDIKFKQGQQWLIYAGRDTATGQLGTGFCDRDRLYKDAGEDLDYARSLRQQPPAPSIAGLLKDYAFANLMAGLKVTAEGGGQTFETTSDGEGRYALTVPKAGAYTVRAYVPFSAEAGSFLTQVKTDPTDEQTVIEYGVTLAAGECTYSEIQIHKVDLHATAEVSGRVVDVMGRPVTRGYVYLIEAAPKEGKDAERDDTKINDDGSFKFKGVAVGSFYLAFNPDDRAPDESDAPHPRTFFPGVADAKQATPLVISEGAKVADIFFRVRGPMKERVVSGRVVWPDGKPVPESRVALYDGAADRYIRSVTADAQGRFRLTIYGDFKYELKAEVFGAKRGESEQVKVPLGGKPAPLRLVLKPE